MEWVAFDSTQQFEKYQIVKMFDRDGISYLCHVVILEVKSRNNMLYCRVVRFKATDPTLNHPAMRAFSQYFLEKDANDKEKIIRYLGAISTC